MTIDQPLISADGLQKTARERVWMGNLRRDQVEYHGPLIIESGDGIHLTSADGVEYIDAMSGAWVVNAGHGRQEIVQAMARQASKTAFVLNEGYVTPATVMLADRLVNLAPGNFGRVFFTSGGSEAIESALKMVRQRAAMTGRPKHRTIGRELSYHGATWGAMSVTGFPDWRWPFSPPVPGASHVPHPTCVKCPLALSYPSCGVACVETFDQAIIKAGPEKVGAVIAEPVSAASSGHVPPPEYWPRLREICTDRGIPLIADEIVTGFGRTGELFGLQHWDVTPDILVVGKGLTSGYAPMAAVLVSTEFAEDLDEVGFVHGFTFSGHPVAAAAAMANLDILLDEDLAGNAARQGARLKANLESGLAGSPIVADVRGLGLLLSIELAAQPAEGVPFPDAFALAEVSKEILLAERVLCRAGPQIRLGPPLSITEAETDDLSDRLVRAVGAIEKKTRAWR